MKTMILTLSFLFMFCAPCYSAYLGEYNGTQFYVDEQQYTEHNGVIETTLISIDSRAIACSNTTIDTNKNMVCMHDTLLIENHNQEYYTSNKWYQYTKDTFIQKAVDYLRSNK